MMTDDQLQQKLQELTEYYEFKIKDIETRNNLLKDRARKKIIQLQNELDRLKPESLSKDPKLESTEASYQLQIAELKAQFHRIAQEHENCSSFKIANEQVQELTTRNFSLEEQVKDLQLKVAQKQTEQVSMDEQLRLKSEELETARTLYEEKLKKLKGTSVTYCNFVMLVLTGLLIIANKNLSEQKEAIARLENEKHMYEETTENLRQQLLVMEASLQAEQGIGGIFESKLI
jgi:hypothetical protein